MEQSKKTFLDRLPKSLIRRDEVSIFPEGALGYLSPLSIHHIMFFFFFFFPSTNPI